MTVTRRSPTVGERAFTIRTETDSVAVTGGYDPLYRLTLESPLTVSLPVTWSSGDTDIATVSASGVVSRVADGSVTITASTPWGAASVSLDVTRVVDDPVPSDPPAVGSAFNDCLGLLDLIDGLTPSSTTRNVFTGYYATDMTRNSSCFASSLDLTGCSPYNSKSGRLKAGTVIASDIIVHAKHFPEGLPVGTTVDFFTSDDTRVTRTVVGSVDIAGTDIRLSRMNSDLPETIARYPILPSDYGDYFPELGVVNRLPLLWIDQYERAKLAEWIGGGSVLEPTNAEALPWYTRPVTGDSGGPVFLLLDESLVLIGCLYGATYAQPLAGQESVLNAAIASLGSEHTVSVVDLSSHSGG